MDDSPVDAGAIAQHRATPDRNTAAMDGNRCLDRALSAQEDVVRRSCHSSGDRIRCCGVRPGAVCYFVLRGILERNITFLSAVVWPAQLSAPCAVFLRVDADCMQNSDETVRPQTCGCARR